MIVKRKRQKTDGCWHSSTGISPRPMLMVRRTMLCGRPMRESHYLVCASSPTGCHTCFAAWCSSLSCLVGGPVLRTCNRVMAHWPTGSTQTDRIRLPYTAPEASAGLSLSRSYTGAPRGKGNTQRPALGQFRSKPRMEIISFVSSRRRKSSSTWGRGKPSRS